MRAHANIKADIGSFLQLIPARAGDRDYTFAGPRRRICVRPIEHTVTDGQTADTRRHDDEARPSQLNPAILVCTGTDDAHRMLRDAPAILGSLRSPLHPRAGVVVVHQELRILLQYRLRQALGNAHDGSVVTVAPGGTEAGTADISSSVHNTCSCASARYSSTICTLLNSSHDETRRLHAPSHVDPIVASV